MATELPGIRDQLGILEASLVPDPDEVECSPTNDLAASIGSIILQEEQDQHNSSDTKLLGTESSALSRTTSTSDSGLLGGESASAGTGPTSATEEDLESPEDELDLLKSLFPNLYVHARRSLLTGAEEA